MYIHIHTCMHAYIHTYVHTYIHIYIYLHLHTYIYIHNKFLYKQGSCPSPQSTQQGQPQFQDKHATPEEMVSQHAAIGECVNGDRT